MSTNPTPSPKIPSAVSTVNSLWAKQTKKMALFPPSK